MVTARKFPILVVEDVPDLRERFIKTLERSGFRAHGADSLESAKALILRQTYAVAIIDVNLQDSRSDVGDKSGHDVIRACKAVNEGTQCLVFTGQKDIDTALGAIDAGMDRIIKKIGTTPEMFQTEVETLYGKFRLNAFGELGDLQAYLCRPQTREPWSTSLMMELSLDASRFSDLLNIAFADILPIRRPINTNYSVSLKRGDGSLRGVFWSRAVGSAVEVIISRESLKASNINDLTEIITEQKKVGYYVRVIKLPQSDIELFESKIEKK